MVEHVDFNKHWRGLCLTKIILAFLQVYKEHGGSLLDFLVENVSSLNLNEMALAMYQNFSSGMFYDTEDHDLDPETPRENSGLLNFAEKTSAYNKFYFNDLAKKPRDFTLRYHLPFIEQSLDVRLFFFHSNDKGDKLLKIRSDLFMDNFMLREISNKSNVVQIRLATVDGRVSFQILRDPVIYDPSVQERFLHHRQLSLCYDFRLKNKCHIGSFRKNFLENLLSLPIREEFVKQSAELYCSHSCSDNNEVCHTIQCLELLYRDMFLGFPHSISFVSYSGQKWFFGKSTTMNKILLSKVLNEKKRECYITTCMLQEIFRYDDPRKDDESENHYLARTREKAKFVVLVSDDGMLYLGRDCVIRHISDRKEPTIRSLDSDRKTSSITSDLELLEVSQKINEYIDRADREKEYNMGQDGFSSDRHEKIFRERLDKARDSLGKSFHKHCSVCSDSIPLMRQHPVGSFQKLFTINLSCWSWFKTFGFSDTKNEEDLKQASELMMCVFDIESRIVAVNDDYKWQSKRPPFSDKIFNSSRRVLGRQKPVLIGMIDGLHVQQGEEPVIFSYPDQKYEDEPELKIWHMIESFVHELMRRQMLLFSKKYDILEKYFSFLSSYHRPILDFFLSEHSLTEEDFFRYNDYETMPNTNLLDPLEEIFFTQNIETFINRLKSVYHDCVSEDEESIDIEDISSDGDFNDCSQNKKTNLKNRDDQELRRIIECVYDIRNFWINHPLGQFQSALINVCKRYFVYAYNLSSYDGILIQSYILSTQRSGFVFHENPNFLGSNSRGSNIRFLKSYKETFQEEFFKSSSNLSKRLAFYFTGKLNAMSNPMFDGLKIKRISLNKDCIMLDAMQMTGKGFSLDALAKTVGLEIEKGEFPYEYVKNLDTLDHQLPTSIEAWESTIGKDSKDLYLNEIRIKGNQQEITEAETREKNRIERIEAKISRAVSLYQQWKCVNLGCFMRCYLKIDCLLLIQSLDRLKNMFRDIIGVDFLDSGNTSISSFANYCVQTYLFEQKRVGLREPSNPFLYANMKNGFLGGLLLTARFYAGSHCPKDEAIKLFKDFRLWSETGRKRKSSDIVSDPPKKKIRSRNIFNCNGHLENEIIENQLRILHNLWRDPDPQGKIEMGEYSTDIDSLEEMIAELESGEEKCGPDKYVGYEDINSLYASSFEKGAPFGPGYYFSNMDSRGKDMAKEDMAKMTHDSQHCQTDPCQGIWDEGEHSCRDQYLDARRLYRDTKTESGYILEGLESLFIQFFGYACFPESRYLFSSITAGPGCLKIGNSKNQIDFSCVLDYNADDSRTSPLILAMFNYHGRRFHRIYGGLHNFYCLKSNEKRIMNICKQFALETIRNLIDIYQDKQCGLEFDEGLFSNRSYFKKMLEECQPETSDNYLDCELEGAETASILSSWKRILNSGRYNVFCGIEDELNYNGDQIFDHYQHDECSPQEDQEFSHLLFREFKFFQGLCMFFLPHALTINIKDIFREYHTKPFEKIKSRLIMWEKKGLDPSRTLEAIVTCLVRVCDRWEQLRMMVMKEFVSSREIFESSNNIVERAHELDLLDYNFETRRLDNFKKRISKCLSKVNPGRILFYYDSVSECYLNCCLKTTPKPYLVRDDYINKMKSYFSDVDVPSSFFELLDNKTRKLVRDGKIVQPLSKHSSIKKYLSECHSHDSLCNEVPGNLFDREFVTQGELVALIRDEIPNMLDRGKCAPFIGFVTLEGGRERKDCYLSGLPGNCFANCQTRDTLNYDTDVGEFTKYQASKNLARITQSEDIADDNISHFLNKKYLESERSVMRLGFPAEKCSTISFNYMSYLLRHRKLSGFKIQHFILYRCKDYISPLIRSMLNERWAIRKQNDKKLLSTCYKLFLNSAYGFNSVESSKYKKCKIITEVNMKRRLHYRMSKKLDLDKKKILKFLDNCTHEEIASLSKLFQPEISTIDVRGIKTSKNSKYCDKNKCFVDKNDGKRKKPEILYRLSLRNKDVRDHNVLHNALNIVSSSKHIILFQIDCLLSVMDPKKFQLMYVDTDSIIWTGTSKCLDDLVWPPLKKHFDELLKAKIFENGESSVSQYGLLKREILGNSFLLRTGKFYNISNETDEIKRAKSVSRNAIKHLKTNVFTQDPNMNSGRVVDRRLAIGEEDQGILMIKDSKDIVHSYCLNRKTVDPVNTIALS